MDSHGADGEPDAPRGSGTRLPAQSKRTLTVGLLTLSQGLLLQQSLEVNHFILSVPCLLGLVVVTVGTTGARLPQPQWVHRLPQPGPVAAWWAAGAAACLGTSSVLGVCHGALAASATPLEPRQADLGGHHPAPGPGSGSGRAFPASQD